MENNSRNEQRRVVKKRKAKKSPNQKEGQEIAIRRGSKLKRIDYSELSFSSESDEGEKSRTPSGNIITHKAKDIRNFFFTGQESIKREGEQNGQC